VRQDRQDQQDAVEHRGVRSTSTSTADPDPADRVRQIDVPRGNVASAFRRHRILTRESCRSAAIIEIRQVVTTSTSLLRGNCDRGQRRRIVRCDQLIPPVAAAVSLSAAESISPI
jgi:hypothetical protein